jgi:hypothetical protein
MSMDAWYVFCFAPAKKIAGPDLNDRLNDCGWEDPVGIEITGDVAAVTSMVPRERFEGPEAEQNLADLHWLLPRVEAHDRVIATAMAGAPVFPLRFGTLFSSGQALAIEMARRRRSLLDFFSAMAGREEWAVKAVLVKDQAIEVRRIALFPEEAVESGPIGRNYLLRQRQKAQAEQALGPWLAQLVTELERELRGLCESVSVRTPTDPVFGNWACLVGPGEAERLHREIVRLSASYTDLGVELHCSGPWPLYSFCNAAGPIR